MGHRIGAEALRIGVISDTHGLVRTEALNALTGSDLVLHAGDVGDPAVLEALRAIAPVYAVRGNVDEPEHLRRKGKAGLDPDWATRLPLRDTLRLEEVTIHVIHEIDALGLDPEAEGIDVVISGHSHQPRCERRGAVLFLNPGSAGPRRFSLPVSVARLRVHRGQAHAELVELDV
ncbi:MAG: metallophosphoesterase family protein [Sandaracinaceae bacterium]